LQIILNSAQNSSAGVTCVLDYSKNPGLNNLLHANHTCQIFNRTNNKFERITSYLINFSA